jgi:RHS repeat-associated protein
VYPDGSERFEYNNNNLKTLYVDKLGNKTSYTYNDAMKIVGITNALGHKTEINYNPLNQISSVIVDGEKKYHNHYDEDGNLLEIEDALQHKTKFSYIEKGVPEMIIQPDGSRIEFVYDERKNIIQITDNAGTKTQYRYDDLNRTIATVDGNGNEQQYKYDIDGNIIEVKNANGDVRSYAYNAAGKVTDITDFNGTHIRREYNSLNKPSKLIDQLGRETLLGYDNMWNLAYVARPNGAETNFVYNALNRLEHIKKPDGSVVSYLYDANGNRIEIKDELGNQTHLKYDALGRLTEVTGEDELQFSYAYNSSGQLTSAADGLGNTVNLIYNAAGQLVQETNAIGNSRKYTYTSLGKIASATDESGRTTTYEYQPGGRLCAAYYPDNTKDIYSYDEGGNIKSYTDRFGQTKAYEYDCLNRVIKAAISTGEAKQYSYDAIGNVISATDEQGNKTTYEYTLTGQLSKVTDAMGNEAIYTYDECDRLIEICQKTDLGLDEELRFATERNEENNQLRIMRYERNIMGQVEAITDALGNRESYGYDACGQLIEKLDKDGYLTKYGYTAHGDVSHIQYTDGREVKLSYNPLRQLTEVEDWLGITKIETDALGRAAKVTNHKNKEVSYVYNSAGLKTDITYPGGKQVSYVYDELLRLQSVSDGLNKTTYSYDEYSRLTEKHFTNGTKTQFLYNDMNRLQELSHWNTDGLLDKFQYDYDVLRNKTAITKYRRELPEENGVYSYAYDTLSRLQSVQKDGNKLRSYEYDGFGNRLKIKAGETQTSYTYNVMNQLICTADSAGDEQHYTYDKRGNLTEIHKNGELLNQFRFGAINRLEKAINHDAGLNCEYLYNGLGHRVGQNIGDDLNPMKQIDDVLDLTRNMNNLLERHENNAATSYIWDSNLLSAIGADGANNYMLDEQGSITRFAGGDGKSELYGYDEFGNMQYGTPNPTQPFGFTGYQHDPIAGTWFAQSREYDAKTGRFTAKDLNRYIHREMTQSLNQYQYCYSNPVRYVDPLGFDLEERMRELFPYSNLNQNAGTNDPLQISIDGNTVTLDVFVDIRGDINTTIDGHCVVDLTIQGIELLGGTHVGVFGEVVYVDVNVHRGSTSRFPRLPWNSSQNYLEINLIDRLGTSNLQRPRGGWSPSNPGVIGLYNYRRVRTDVPHVYEAARRNMHHFRNVSTHEIVHALGVNDANREWRNDDLIARGEEPRYPNRPNADMLENLYNEVMGFGVHRRDDMYFSRYTIQMMLYAMMTGNWQKFMEYERGPQSITLNPEIQKG